MSRILVFSGTEDGRKLAEVLARTGHFVTVCVATEYGEELMQETEQLKVHRGRMDVRQMEQFLSENGFAHVVDATHPYATEVSENIQKACAGCRVPYLRMLRDSFSDELAGEDIYEVNCAADAMEYLSEKEGQIFISTGSKELPAIMEHIGDPGRLVIRILPDAEAIRMCTGAGIKRKQLICMQGPFSEEMNAAMFRQSGSRYLVTKESGSPGGFLEKIRAARACGMETVVIRRPKETGMSFKEILEYFCVPEPDAGCGKTDLCGKKASCGEKQIFLVGIGMGSLGGMTVEAAHICKKADLFIGAKRMIDAVADIRRPEQKAEYLYLADPIRACIDESGAEKIVVLLSGDSGFYSGARKLLKVLPDYEVHVIPGISTVAALAAKWRIAWDDMKIVSLHGRENNLADAVRHNRKVFALAGGADGVSEACKKLCACGLGETEVLIGSNLSYPEERLERGQAADYTEYRAAGVSALIIQNDRAENRKTTHGLPDDAFLRGKVPMTKEEVRAVSLAKLRLHADSVVYDIGAGTGSVSIECALCAPEGTVFAIEHDPAALELLKENRKGFGLSNVQIVAGFAPDVLEGLPTPTHAFIGGSGGKLSKIVDYLFQKNPNVRIVANAISLETLSELTEIIRKRESADAEIVQLQVSRSKKAGSHHLMLGNNPVYIVSF